MSFCVCCCCCVWIDWFEWYEHELHVNVISQSESTNVQNNNNNNETKFLCRIFFLIVVPTFIWHLMDTHFSFWPTRNYTQMDLDLPIEWTISIKFDRLEYFQCYTCVHNTFIVWFCCCCFICWWCVAVSLPARQPIKHIHFVCHFQLYMAKIHFGIVS